MAKLTTASVTRESDLSSFVGGEVTSTAEPRGLRPEQVRLDLKVVGRSDLNQVLSTMDDPSTVRNVAFMRWPMGIDQVERWASSSVDDGGNDRFIARLSGTNEVVGCSSLWRSPDEAPELGYWIMEARRGLGLGFELANLTLQYAEDNWDSRRFTAITSLSNRPSQQILTKLGFQVTAETTLKTGDGELRPSLRWLRA